MISICTKVCSKCKQELPLTTEYFHKRKLDKDGFRSICKTCRGTKNIAISTKEGYRICKKCDIEKPLDAFNKKNNGYLGRRSECRECQRTSSNEYCNNPQGAETRSKLLDEYRFGGNRGVVLERDGHQCTLCGSDYILQVHHIDGNGRNKSKEEQNNELDNLTTLCVSCHARVHKGKVAI